MMADVDVESARELLDELYGAKAFGESRPADERYAGALSMLGSLGFGWSCGDDGRHEVIDYTRPGALVI